MQPDNDEMTVSPCEETTKIPRAVWEVAQGLTELYRKYQDVFSRCAFELKDIQSREALQPIVTSLLAARDAMAKGRPDFAMAFQRLTGQRMGSLKELGDARALLDALVPDWAFEHVEEHYLLRWTDADDQAYQTWKIPTANMIVAIKAALFDSNALLYAPADAEERALLTRTIEELFRVSDEDDEEEIPTFPSSPEPERQMVRYDPAQTLEIIALAHEPLPSPLQALFPTWESTHYDHYSVYRISLPEIRNTQRIPLNRAVEDGQIVHWSHGGNVKLDRLAAISDYPLSICQMAFDEICTLYPAFASARLLEQLEGYLHEGDSPEKSRGMVRQFHAVAKTALEAESEARSVSTPLNLDALQAASGYDALTTDHAFGVVAGQYRDAAEPAETLKALLLHLEGPTTNSTIVRQFREAAAEYVKRIEQPE